MTGVPTLAEMLVVEADGGSRGNPGPAGYGALVRDAETGAVLGERAAAIGRATNNVAEYSGLLAGLEAAVELVAARRAAGRAVAGVEVRMDSKLVVEQMSGRWRVRHPDLVPLVARARRLVAQLPAVRFSWVPREQNTAADALANRAMDAAAGRVRESVVGRRTAGAAPAGSGPSPAAGPRRSRLAVARPGPTAERSDQGRPPTGPVAGMAAPMGGAIGVAASARPAAGTPDPGTTLWVLRHGETSASRAGVLDGRPGAGLTARGREQVQAAARRLASAAEAPTGVLCSPLPRAQESAAIICAVLGGQPEVLDGLADCDFGGWAGSTYADLAAAGDLEGWLADPDARPPGGERLADVADRVRATLAEILAAHPGQSLCLVTHAAVVRVLLADVLGAPLTRVQRLSVATGGLSRLAASPAGWAQILQANDTCHLAEVGLADTPATSGRLASS